MKITFVSLALAAILLAGCTAEPMITPIEFPKEPVRHESVARDPAPNAESLAPVDRWRRDLERIAPVGWTVEDPVDQIESPDGWSRIEGGRGISITIVNRLKRVDPGSRPPRFVLALFPTGWQGKDGFDDATPMKLFGASSDWILFYDPTSHEGWEKPEEDVARTFHVPCPAKG
jgi:hypothetical protein